MAAQIGVGTKADFGIGTTMKIGVGTIVGLGARIGSGVKTIMAFIVSKEMASVSLQQLA